MSATQTDGDIRAARLECMSIAGIGAIFTDAMGGDVIVEVAGHKALVRREEIAAVAALFPVRHPTRHHSAL